MRRTLGIKLGGLLLALSCLGYILMPTSANKHSDSTQLILPARSTPDVLQESHSESLATLGTIYKSDLCKQRGAELENLKVLSSKAHDASNKEFLAWAIPWWENEETLYCN